MKFRSTYKAAHLVAATIESHFAQHVEEALKAGEQNIAPVPSVETIESIIDVGFWASLRREEGHSPKISLAYTSPDQVEQPLTFAKKLPFNPQVLTKLAPGVERPGIHLGVWNDGDGLYLWGTTRSIPGICFVLELIEPGLLIIKHRRFSGFGKFVNVAILKGDEIKIVDEQSGNLPDCPKLLTSLLSFSSTSSWNDSVNILVQLAASMRAHGRGGTLLVVPSGTSDWKNSIVHPISYPVVPAFKGLSDLMLHSQEDKNKPQWQATLTRLVDTVAGYTAIDGATVITDKHELLAFGAKIVRSDKGKPVEQVILTEPIIGGEASVIHPAQNGGTRHLSAAQFVSDQRDSIALVASQDGKFTIFGWSHCEEMVHAHRVDSLLM
ncbi:putative sensor domain DACNV-containing protein [Rubrolithibacter danxiaensis]|uniref:putative sensor domain DACNV-containing protein n=1 Tax=Rubrolithibacter danxiaensis TaxID=3390805 RepID=UPI003BF7857E